MRGQVMKKVTTFIALALLLTLCAAPVYAQGIPPLPHAFYGNVTINNNPAPAGATVEARGTGVLTGIAGNPVTTTVAGVYGTSNPFEPRLIVQGDIDEGATITFYVNGRSTGQTAEWHSGVTTQINLDVTIAAVGGGAPGGAPAYTEVEATLFGEEALFLIDDEGEIQETIIATSEDENLDLTIKEGTTALDEDGDPLSWLWADVDPSPPNPPEDASIIGLAYDFGPDGATFDPPIKLEYTYDPDDVPEDVAEKDLVIAYYDEEDEEWVELDCVVDTVHYTITASVPHFTIFAIIARTAPPPPAPAPAPPPVVAPAPPAPPAPPMAPPLLPPAPPLLPPAPPINWLLIGGLIAAAVIAILLIYFWWVRRRASSPNWWEEV
jgi:hypothetical protein